MLVWMMEFTSHPVAAVTLSDVRNYISWVFWLQATEMDFKQEINFPIEYQVPLLTPLNSQYPHTPLFLYLDTHTHTHKHTLLLNIMHLFFIITKNVFTSSLKGDNAKFHAEFLGVTHFLFSLIQLHIDIQQPMNYNLYLNTTNTPIQNSGITKFVLYSS